MAKKKTISVDESEDFLTQKPKFAELDEVVQAAQAFNLDDLEDGETLETGAQFYKFDEDSPELIARFINNVIAKEDGENWKKGDVIGFNMQMSNGDYTICPNNFLIAEHLTNAKPMEIFKITFKGKHQQANGRPISTFHIVKMQSRKK